MLHPNLTARLLGGALLALAALPAAQAHNFWLRPSTTVLSAPAWITASGLVLPSPLPLTGSSWVTPVVVMGTASPSGSVTPVMAIGTN